MWINVSPIFNHALLLWVLVIKATLRELLIALLPLLVTTLPQSPLLTETIVAYLLD